MEIRIDHGPRRLKRMSEVLYLMWVADLRKMDIREREMHLRVLEQHYGPIRAAELRAAAEKL